MSASVPLEAAFRKETELVNLYGATEATMMQCYHKVEPADLKRDFIPSDGRCRTPTSGLTNTELRARPNG
jgi:hypothetical protein